MFLVKRIGLLIIFSLAGAVIMFIYGRASLQGAFNKWGPLGKPPGGADKFVAFDYVQTASGDIYRYDYKEGCIDDCWVKSDAPSSDNSKYDLPSGACSDLSSPALDNFVDSRAVCELYGVGISMKIEAIDKKGFVYSWSHTSGEWDGLIPWISSFIGAAAGLMIGLIVLLVILYLDLLKWLQKRAKQKGVAVQA
jgi:hypothetical protein